MRKTTLLAALLLVATGTVRAEQTVDASRSVAPDATISIENIAGSLKIFGGDAAEVRITGTLGDDVEELELSGDAEELAIEVAIPEDDDWQGERKIAANLEIRVPSGASLEVETVSAWVEISGVRGEIEAASVSGTVTVTGGAGEIEVESVSGAVSVSGGAGTVVAESVSGKVTLEGVSGDIEATTVSGPIRVDAGSVGDVEIESVAGGVFFKGNLGSGSLEIESHSGNVEVLLPADVSAEFELESFSGRIENELGPPARRVDRYEPGVSAEFYTGSGAGEVSIETFSGNISLKKY